MRIIHGEGYTPEERRQHVKLVYQNVFMAIQSLIHAVEILGIGFNDPSAEVSMKKSKPKKSQK